MYSDSKINAIYYPTEFLTSVYMEQLTGRVEAEAKMTDSGLWIAISGI